MNHLLTLQKDFLETYKGTPGFVNQIKVSGPTPLNRLSIYQNNIVQALIKCLSLTYPLTWKLIGEDCADAAGYIYVSSTKSLPDAGNIDKWGHMFPDFLETYEYTSHLSYVPDFARLEWLKHVSYGEEDLASLTPNDFSNLKPEDLSNLTFTLHPSAFLFSSNHPLDQVMGVLDGSLDTVTLDQRGVSVLIIRPLIKVEIHWLSKDYYKFLSLLKEGNSLIEALEKLEIPDFPFHEFLLFCLKTGVFKAYSIR